MLTWLDEWTQPMGHWHYILGYLIILTLHNWPIMVTLVLSLHSAIRLYRSPTRRNVQFLYGWALLAFTYEYVKHLGDYLAEPAGFLLTTDWWWMQSAARFVIQQVPPPLILILAVLVLLKALGKPPIVIRIVGKIES